MALPLLLGLGGAGLAGAGMIGLSPLMAGAVGSGLGSMAQGDDLGTAIGTGFLTYLGGKTIGGAFGGTGADAIAPAVSGSGVGSALTNPYTLGALGTAGIASMKPEEYKRPERKKYERDESAQDSVKRRMEMPGDRYRAGIDPEFRYFRGFQEGGEVEAPNDKELISNAVEAIKGRSEAPEMALGAFLARYGEEALRDLVERVESGQFDMDQQVEEGKVNGVGDGMDDMIPATLEGEQDVVLSDGEFIVPADVVSGLGNGSTDAGADALYEMMDRVREMRTGKTEQPEQVPQEDMLPA